MNYRKNIIFDFDGVIAETEYGRYQLLSIILKKYDFDFKKKFTVKDIAGIPTDIFLQNNFPQFSSTELKMLVSKRRELFFNNLSKYCSIMVGAVQTIRDLNKEGHHLFLATLNNAIDGERLLQFIGIENEFIKKFYRESILNKETSKKDYLKVLKTLNLNGTDCVVIEDSVTGLSSAKKCSMYSIGFNSHNSKDIQRIADQTVNNYNELRVVFDLMPI